MAVGESLMVRKGRLLQATFRDFTEQTMLHNTTHSLLVPVAHFRERKIMG